MNVQMIEGRLVALERWSHEPQPVITPKEFDPLAARVAKIEAALADAPVREIRLIVDGAGQCTEVSAMHIRARSSDAPERASSELIDVQRKLERRVIQREVARLTAALEAREIVTVTTAARVQRAREEEREAILGIVRGAVMNLDAQAVLIQAIEARARSTP